MTRWAIGDVQGCWKTLEALLKQIGFPESGDHLWFTGDLVNRGPASLEVLRWARAWEHRITAVLGNHDLHLIALHLGISKKTRRDTLDQVLEAHDADDLIAWLRTLPLVHREGNHMLVHAGLLPAWTEDETLERGARISEALRNGRASDLIHVLRHEPGHIDPEVVARAHDAAILTRLRVCTPEGLPALKFKDSPRQSPPGHQAWFNHPHRRHPSTRILFGHWARLLGEPALSCEGVTPRSKHTAKVREDCLRRNVIPLDSGCVWGHSLTAYRLEDGCFVEQESCDPARKLG